MRAGHFAPVLAEFAFEPPELPSFSPEFSRQAFARGE